MDRKEEMRIACEKFHEENPDFWDLFVRFTFEKINEGFEHYGGDAILARVRWETKVGAPDPELNFNNNFKPFFTRRFAAMHPEHATFFRFRRQISAGKPPKGPEPTRTDLDRER